jgi:hypothetical protein
LQTHHEASNTSCAKKSADVVDLFQDITCCILLIQARRILVAEDAKNEANEVPHSDQNAIVSPVADLSDHLSVENRGAKREDGEHHESHVLAAVLDRYRLASTRKRNEFIKASADARKDLPS